MIEKLYHQEKGQAVVIVALALVGLIGFLALVIDGGAAFAARRQMQNAADSAAIAGARELEAGNRDESAILKEIHAYAEANRVPDSNGVPNDGINDNVEAYFISGISKLRMPVPCELDEEMECVPIGTWGYVPPNAGGVEVIARTSFDAYFAAVVGQDTLGAAARAKVLAQGPPAGSMVGLFPVAVFNPDPNGPGDPWLDANGDPLMERVIIWDNESEAPGSFGWVDFNGGNNSNNDIKNWVENGYPGNIEVPSCVETDTGNRGQSTEIEGYIRQALTDVMGSVFYVPVYTDFCEGTDPVGGNALYNFVIFAKMVLTGYDYGPGKHVPDAFDCPAEGPPVADGCMEAIFLGYVHAPEIAE